MYQAKRNEQTLVSIPSLGNDLPPLPSTTFRAPWRDIREVQLLIGTQQDHFTSHEMKTMAGGGEAGVAKAWQPHCLPLALDLPTFHPVRSLPVPLTRTFTLCG